MSENSELQASINTNRDGQAAKEMQITMECTLVLYVNVCRVSRFRVP